MRAAEFFAGIGLMRAGLERVGATTVFANDIDRTKAALYRANWGDDTLVVDDIRNLTGDDIPDAEVATASFPYVNMSLAGHLAGLDGEHSGLITEFCRILAEMGERRPTAVIAENVPGFIAVNDGRDFAQIVGMLETLPSVPARRARRTTSAPRAAQRCLSMASGRCRHRGRLVAPRTA